MCKLILMVGIRLEVADSVLLRSVLWVSSNDSIKVFGFFWSRLEMKLASEPELIRAVMEYFASPMHISPYAVQSGY